MRAARQCELRAAAAQQVEPVLRIVITQRCNGSFECAGQPLLRIVQQAFAPDRAAGGGEGGGGVVRADACDHHTAAAGRHSAEIHRRIIEVPFEYYGTQFPVMVKWLDIQGRTSLHVNPDDEAAEQRYDAFGKTALWYVAEAGADAKLFLGFKREVTAEEFWRKCQDGTVEDLLNVVKPKVGEHYLVTPGMVHAAQDVRLLEVAESSELWFRLHAWDDPEAELHLEEAFDLIDFKPFDEQEHNFMLTVADLLKSKGQIPCTACAYCMPCPAGVDIPGNFKIFNSASDALLSPDAGDKNVIEKRKAFLKAYKAQEEGVRADAV